MSVSPKSPDAATVPMAPPMEVPTQCAFSIESRSSKSAAMRA